MVKSTRLNIFHFIFRSIFCYITLGAVNWWSRSSKDSDSGGLWVILLVGDTNGTLGWAGQYAHGVADRSLFVVEEGSGR